MLSLIRNPRKPQPFSGPRGRARAPRPALGVEVLDQRLAPSVTPSLSNGVLTLQGDAGNDTVKVLYIPDLLSPDLLDVYVVANFKDGTHGKRWHDPDVQQIHFVGGGGTDYFANTTSIPTQADGRGSHATLIGGSGDNTFWIDGNDTIVPGSGNNVTYGLAGGRLTTAELGAKGQLAVSLSGQTLTLSGPGGAGFQIVGNWAQSGEGTASTFAASGSLTLKSALGNIPLVVPAAAPLTVNYSADNMSVNEGVVTNITLSGIPDLSVNGTGLLKSLSKEAGLDVSLPSVSWGIELGSSLATPEFPVNAGVPYLYASAGNGFSVTFGGAGVSTEGDTLNVAFDPADPSVVVQVGNFAAGASIKGYIPFTPVNQPSAAAGKQIFGNLFGEATDIQLGALPVTVSGSVVLNLDANNDGKLLGISGNTFSNVLRGKENLASLAANALNDLAVGINGTLSVGYDLDGFDITLPVATATVMYSPGNFDFRGSNLDLFANTPLEKAGSAAQTILQSVSNAPTYSVDGSISWGSGGVKNWHVTAEADNVTLGATFKATQVQFTLANTGITADAQVSGLLGLATIDLHGQVKYNGTFTLTANGGANLDAGPCDLDSAYIFTFSNTGGSVRLSASATGSFHFEIDVLGVDVADASGSLSGTLTFSADSGGVNVSGKGHVQGGAHVLGVGETISASVTFNDDGFSVELPDSLPDLSIKW
jgi:hypothetical protein